MTGVDLTEETTFTCRWQTIPEAFRFSLPSAPGRHLAAAAIDLTRDLEVSDGIRAAGHTKSNITGLVPGTRKHERLLATCPPSAGEDEITAIVARSTEGW
jgi:alcohol dehydrogenase class IV